MGIMKIKISEIRDNPTMNKRVDTDSKIFRAFIESIKELGIVHPVMVIEHMDDSTLLSFYTVTDGLMRVAAAIQLGILEIPAIVNTMHYTSD
jgi:ParB-like chromosome segregation protein Spo0J